MPVTGKPTGTPGHKVYCKLSNSSSIDSIQKVEGLGELGDCITFGPITATGNPSEWTPYGSGTTKSIAGAASLGEFPVRVVVTESNQLHAAIINASVGAAIEVGLVKSEGSNKVAYYAYGEIASNENAFETPAEFGFSLALAAKPTRIAT